MDKPSGHDNSACARVWQVLRMAHDRIERRLSAAFAEIDLTITDFDVLLYLHSHSCEGVRIGSILESVALSQPALSRLIARLVDRGLILRSGSEADGRAIQVSLSDDGRARFLTGNRCTQRDHPRCSVHSIHLSRTRSAPSGALPHHLLSASAPGNSSCSRHLNEQKPLLQSWA